MAACAVERPVPAALPPPHDLGLPPIISGFGEWVGTTGRTRRWQHYGIDLRAAVGTAVLAAAAGTVARTGTHPNAGQLVVVAHNDDLATVYWHLSEVAVRPGQAVGRGEVLGRSGMTGNATTPHLHFGVCRRPLGQCGSHIDAGWDDPASHWVEGRPCFAADRAYEAAPPRLTYPLPCGE
jgi:murein DD-endopeptidase MepM/ murein hydrolase activator NlpD